MIPAKSVETGNSVRISGHVSIVICEPLGSQPCDNRSLLCLAPSLTVSCGLSLHPVSSLLPTQCNVCQSLLKPSVSLHDTDKSKWWGGDTVQVNVSIFPCPSAVKHSDPSHISTHPWYQFLKSKQSKEQEKRPRPGDWPIRTGEDRYL